MRRVKTQPLYRITDKLQNRQINMGKFLPNHRQTVRYLREVLPREMRYNVFCRFIGDVQMCLGFCLNDF